ncbi:unnamed protein product [Allacma fusca]|uniref:Uncharacterized protein n=1 Tax=Allacma fusca TaxID=39272 RepID=A0A8J2JT14_9HEXA|nr:unnamed protein product [Allacma fusca]
MAGTPSLARKTSWSIWVIFSIVFMEGNGNFLPNSAHKINQVWREESTITCRGEDGQAVDWFVAYKLAKIPDSDNPIIREGCGHALLHPGLDKWVLSTKSINDSNTAVGFSTQYIFQQEQLDRLLYLTYNDQPPDAKAVEAGGHTKGVIIANSVSGIWLQHTVPHFPSTEGKYLYPHTGAHNGQIFFCMSLNPDKIDETVAGILAITKPNIYSQSFPPIFNNVYPNLRKLLPKKRAKGRKKSRPLKSQNFNLTVGTMNFTVFAKSPKNKQEIYADWIAPTLKSNLKVQSWLNGPHPLACTLKPYTVLNIDDKKLGVSEFSTHDDHSKWAIGEKEWTCISDLNRMDHQKVRGGAALCTLDATLWSNFHDIITSLQPCPPKTQKHTSHWGRNVTQKFTMPDNSASCKLVNQGIETLMKSFTMLATVHVCQSLIVFLDRPEKSQYLSSVFLKLYHHWSVILFFGIYEFLQNIFNWCIILFYIFTVFIYMRVIGSSLKHLSSKLSACESYSELTQHRLEFHKMQLLNQLFKECCYPIVLVGHRLVVVCLTIAGSYGTLNLFHLTRTRPKLYGVYFSTTLTVMLFQYYYYKASTFVYENARAVQCFLMKNTFSDKKDERFSHIFRGLPKRCDTFFIFNQWRPPQFFKKIMFACIKMHFYLHSNVDVFQKQK